MIMIDKKTTYGLLLIILVCLLSWSNNLSNEPILDDISNLTGTSARLNLNEGSSFELSRKEGTGSAGSFNSFRPLAYLALKGLRFIFGPDYFYYHIVAIFLFAFYCIVGYLFLKELFADSKAAFLAVILFACNPINSMMVNYVVAAMVALYALFLLFCFLFLLKFIKTKNKAFYFISLLFFIVSLYFHEIAVIGVVYIFLAFLIIDKSPIFYAFRKTAYFLAAGVFALFFRPENTTSILGFLSGKASGIVTSPVESFYAMASLFAWYLKALVFSKDIIFVYSLSPSGAQINFPSVALIGLSLLLFLIFCSGRAHKGLSWGAGILLVGFIPLPIACFTIPYLGLTIQPYWFYFSSLGYFIVLAYLLLQARKKINKQLWYLIVLVLIFTSILNTRNYNRIQKSQESYARFWLKVLPHDKSARYYLAYSLMQKGIDKEAYANFKKALVGDFSDWEIHNNLALICLKRGEFKEAKEELEKGIGLNPGSAILFNTLGLLFYRQEDFAEAEKYFIKAISLERGFLPEPRLNLANIYRRQGKSEKLSQLYESVIKEGFYNGEAVIGLVEIYLSRGEGQKALALASEAHVRIDDPATLINLAGILAQKGHAKMAFRIYNKVINETPDFAPAYIEMGKLLGNLNEFDKAIVLWQKAQRLSSDSGIKVLIQTAQQLKGREEALAVKGGK
ncbi:MAG: tetratricopeptide repeat protein [Candidatus Omnitrophica bacterium]|nr:tetratricopeptide repeat protein [Candidatus Omnitrophota bacterium]